MIEVGEPYKKMRGWARSSDKRLSHITGWSLALSFASSLAGLFVTWVYANMLLGLILMGLAAACVLLVVHPTDNALRARNATWRPITKPVEVWDVFKTYTAHYANPGDVTAQYAIAFVETGDERREVVGPFDDTIKIGDHVTGDIVPSRGWVRNLRVVPASA